MPMNEGTNPKEDTVKTLRQMFSRPARAGSGSGFDRYYGGIVRAGAGYPTADEARRDLADHQRTLIHNGWMR